MTTTKPEFTNFEQLIVFHMENALKEKTVALYEEKKKEIIERLDRDKGEVCAGILVSLMKQTDMQIMQDRIIFTIRDGNKTV